MSYKVFISYAMEDKLVADAACAALEARRIACWIAPRDLVADEEHSAAIVEKLSRCQIVLLIFSAYANNSQLVRSEIEWATSQGKTVVPLRLDEIESSEAFKFVHSNTHWLDALTPPLEDYLVHLCDKVALLLEEQKQFEAPLWSSHTATAVSGRQQVANATTVQAPVAKAISISIAEPVGVSAQKQSAEPHLSKAVEPPSFTLSSGHHHGIESEAKEDGVDEPKERRPFWTTFRAVIAVLLCVAFLVSVFMFFGGSWRMPQAAQPAQNVPDESSTVPYLKPSQPLAPTAKSQKSSQSKAKPAEAGTKPVEETVAPAKKSAESPPQNAKQIPQNAKPARESAEGEKTEQ